MTFAIGQQVADGLTIRGAIEAGALFESYRAEDALGRLVFFKIARADLGEPTRQAAEAHEPLWRELARAEIHGMPRIMQLGRVDGRLFVTTQWIDGFPLSAIAEQGGVAPDGPEAFVHTLLAQILAALAGLHSAGIVHGDISPSNILYAPARRQFWLIDPSPGERTVIASGTLWATAGWIAPETRAGAPRAPAADLYALGRVAHQLSRMFPAPPGVTIGARPVGAVIERMMRDDPSERPAVDAALAMLAARRGVESAPPPPPPTTMAPPRRRTFQKFIKSLPRFRPAAPDRAETRSPPEPPSPPPEPPPSAPDPFADRDMAVGSAPPPDGLDDFGGFVGAAPPAPAQSLPGADWSSRTSLHHVPVRSAADADPRRADFFVMGPTRVARERSFPLELWVGPSERAEELRERASNRGQMIEKGSRVDLALSRLTVITAIVRLPGFTIADPIEQIHWDGDIRNVAFLVEPPPNVAPGRYAGIVKLMIGELPFGTISFWVDVGEGVLPDADPSPRGAGMQRFRSAFASYSRRNTADVFKRVQAIRAASIDIFVDIVNLRGGDRWQDVLMREIAEREAFYLFWSEDAARSPWVEREWREALDRKGLDYICPIPLDDPRKAPPPAELSALHFDDWCLAIIRGIEAAAPPPRKEG